MQNNRFITYDYSCIIIIIIIKNGDIHLIFQYFNISVIFKKKKMFFNLIQIKARHILPFYVFYSKVPTGDLL